MPPPTSDRSLSATAAAHSVPDDFLRLGVDDVLALVGGASDVKR